VPFTASVVGVVAPSRHQLLEDGMRPHIYTPAAQNFRAAMFLHARTNAATPEAEAAMLPDVRRMLVAIDPELPIIALETRPMYRDRNLILWVVRAGAQIFLAFGLLALFMTVVGVYGVKSYVVARRTREIGIRVALGATRRDVVRMVVRLGAAVRLLVHLPHRFAGREDQPVEHAAAGRQHAGHHVRRFRVRGAATGQAMAADEARARLHRHGLRRSAAAHLARRAA
jgi:hypothetical protein